MNNRLETSLILGQLALFSVTGALEAGQDEIAAFLDDFIALVDKASQADAWEGRYDALLEKVEASRPRPYEGDGNTLPPGTVVLDKDGDVWQRSSRAIWKCVSGSLEMRLNSNWGPYIIIYTPEEES